MARLIGVPHKSATDGKIITWHRPTLHLTFSSEVNLVRQCFSIRENYYKIVIGRNDLMNELPAHRNKILLRLSGIRSGNLSDPKSNTATTELRTPHLQHLKNDSKYVIAYVMETEWGIHNGVSFKKYRK